MEKNEPLGDEDIWAGIQILNAQISSNPLNLEKRPTPYELMLSSGLKVIKRLLPFKITDTLPQGLSPPSLLAIKSITSYIINQQGSVGPEKEER